MSLANALRSDLRGRLITEEYEFNVIPSGIVALDAALGGGFACGRICELFGNESTGKSLVTYMVLAEVQKRKGVAGLADTEGAFVPAFYRDLGGDPDGLIRPADCETVEALAQFIADVCDKISDLRTAKKKRDRSLSAFGWDSVAATPTKHLLDVGMGKKDLSKSLALSQAMQLLTEKIQKSETAVMCVNQVREIIDSMDSALHTPGGRAIKFHASQRVSLQFSGGSKTSRILDETLSSKPAIGRKVRGTVVKNKIAAPLREFWLPIYTEEGHTHPVFGTPTRFGIDLDEALLEHYTKASYSLVGGKRLVEATSGWYKLHPAVGDRKFRAKEWPAILAEYPKLKELDHGYE